MSSKSPSDLRKSRNGDVSSNHQWKILLFGQCIALSLASCSATSSTLQKMPGIKNMPLFQIAGGYFCLGLNIIQMMMKNDNSSNRRIGDVSHRYHHNDKLTNHLETQDNVEESSFLLGDGSNSIQMRNYTIEQDLEHQGLCKDNKNMFKLPFFRNIFLMSPWYFYMLLAFLDVQANYLVVLSFRYTSLINTNLLTSISVISVMSTSKLILGRIFTLPHFMGVFLVLLGSMLIVSSDFGKRYHPNHSNNDNNIANESDLVGIHKNVNDHIHGDVFAIIAALLFGLNDTLAEYCIHHSTANEYLAMLGIFGCFFSLCESIIFESNQLKQLYTLILTSLVSYKSNTGINEELLFEMNNNNFNDEELNYSDDDKEEVNFVQIFIIWSIYILSLVFFYTSASHFLRIADATLLSLSLQSSNMWTMMFSILVQHVYPAPLFYLSVLFIFVGVWIYEKGMIYYDLFDHGRNWDQDNIKLVQ